MLNANPLTDIKNTRQIDSVYIGGRKVNIAAVRAQLATEAISFTILATWPTMKRSDLYVYVLRPARLFIQ